jgi:hypothetical protein
MFGGVFDDITRCCSDLDNIKYSSINLGDKFIHHYGSYAEHCTRLGLTSENLAEKAVELYGI